MVRQIFNEIIRQNEFTPEAWKTVKKKCYTRKVMWKMLETTARYAHCQRCTKCSRQYCTVDFSTTRPKTSGGSGRIQKLIPDNRSSRDVQDDRTEMPRAGYQKCGQRQLTSRRHSTPSHTNQVGMPSSLAIEHDYISLLNKLYRDQKASVQTDVESNMFEIKKGTKQGDPLSSLLFNTVLFEKSIEKSGIQNTSRRDENS